MEVRSLKSQQVVGAVAIIVQIIFLYFLYFCLYFLVNYRLMCDADLHLASTIHIFVSCGIVIISCYAEIYMIQVCLFLAILEDQFPSSPPQKCKRSLKFGLTKLKNVTNNHHNHRYHPNHHYNELNEYNLNINRKKYENLDCDKSRLTRNTNPAARFNGKRLGNNLLC